MARMVRIYSANSEFQRLEVLKSNRNKRHQHNEFFVEGVRNISETVKNGWSITGIIYSAERELSEWAKGVIRANQVAVHYVLTKLLMKKLSDKEETSELLATVSIPKDDLSRIILGTRPFVAVFDRPSSRGNLGTVIRSCDALGCQGLIISGHAVDLYDPETIRATTGSFFSMPSVRVDSHKEFAEWIASIKSRYGDLQIVGTSAHAEDYVENCDWTKPTVLLLGNETHGLSYAYKEISDTLVKIPIGGSATSLNVACAASILLYEAARQRKYRR